MCLKTGQRRGTTTSYEAIADMMRPTAPETWSRNATRNLVTRLRQKGHTILTIRGYGFRMGRAPRPWREPR
jgi:biotin operon repressor